MMPSAPTISGADKRGNEVSYEAKFADKQVDRARRNLGSIRLSFDRSATITENRNLGVESAPRKLHQTRVRRRGDFRFVRRCLPRK
jgi:hypothetical protein